MATISQQEFLKSAKKLELVAPASANFGVPEKEDQGYASKVFSNLKNTLRQGAEKITSNIQNTTKIAEKVGGGKLATTLSALSTAGHVAGNVAGTAGGVLGSFIEPALPESAKRTIGNVAGFIDEKIKSIPGMTPEIQQALGDVFNTVSLLGGNKASQVAKEGAGQLATKTAELGGQLKNQTGKSLIKTGEKIQDVVLKPSLTDVKNGFKIENVTKYGLNGTLGEMAPKTTALIKNLNNQLTETIKGIGQEPKINLRDALGKLESDFKAKGVKNLGSKTSIDNTVETIQKELDQILPNWRNESISFSDAVDAKRAAGLNSAFLHGQIPQGLTAADRVWNDLYKILQKETEKAAEGTAFKDLNTQISELIPIEQAIIRRIPVADRNNLISLPDIIAGVATVSNPKALTIGVLNHALKSGFVAKNLVKAGKALIKK